MKRVSATEASRRFAELLDSVEGQGDSFLVVRRGRPVATIRPVVGDGGKSLKEALRGNRPDPEWAAELAELRSGLDPVPDPWHD